MELLREEFKLQGQWGQGSEWGPLDWDIKKMDFDGSEERGKCRKKVTFFFFFGCEVLFPTEWSQRSFVCEWLHGLVSQISPMERASFYCILGLLCLFVYRDGGFSVLPLVVWLYTVTSVVWWWALLMFSCPFTNRYVTYVFASYSHSINWHWECHIKIIIKLHNWKKKNQSIHNCSVGPRHELYFPLKHLKN